MSVMCFRTDKPSNCGIFRINDKNIAIEFHEKVNNPPGNLANGAIYILSKEIITTPVEDALELMIKNGIQKSRKIILFLQLQHFFYWTIIEKYY